MYLIKEEIESDIGVDCDYFNIYIIIWNFWGDFGLCVDVVVYFVFISCITILLFLSLLLVFLVILS